MSQSNLPFRAGTDNSNSEPSITHVAAVPVGHFNDGIAAIWWGLILNLTGLYPLILFLITLDTPNLLHTLGAWLSVSWLLIIGTLSGAAGVKVKGHQKGSIRIFGIVSLFLGILFLLIPTFAVLIYASSSGL